MKRVSTFGPAPQQPLNTATTSPSHNNNNTNSGSDGNQSPPATSTSTSSPRQGPNRLSIAARRTSTLPTREIHRQSVIMMNAPNVKSKPSPSVDCGNSNSDCKISRNQSNTNRKISRAVVSAGDKDKEKAKDKPKEPEHLILAQAHFQDISTSPPSKILQGYALGLNGDLFGWDNYHTSVGRRGGGIMGGLGVDDIDLGCDESIISRATPTQLPKSFSDQIPSPSLVDSEIDPDSTPKEGFNPHHISTYLYDNQFTPQQTNLFQKPSRTPYMFKIATDLSQSASSTNLYTFYTRYETDLIIWNDHLDKIVTKIKIAKRELQKQLYDVLTYNFNHRNGPEYLNPGDTCSVCEKGFNSIFTPKKHCKSCLDPVCKACSQEIQLGHLGKVRVCKACNHTITSR